MRRALGAAAAAALMVLMLAPAAIATPPERLSLEFEQTLDIEAGDLCSFPVTITIEQEWQGINRYDADGNPIGYEFWVRGVDTLSAVRTLVSEPYTYHVAGIDADGPQMKATLAGVTEKIRLPDGTWYLAAGWFTYLDKDPFALYLNPDRGSMGDIEALCAALD
jgi:hypothetical protein